MNISCSICSDILMPTSEVYSTTCGHMFHYVCLQQWISRSKTCPECRQKTTEKSIHKIFLNLATSDGIVDDVIVLQSKLDTMNFQMLLKQKEAKLFSDKYHKSKEQAAGLRESIKTLERKEKLSESAHRALQDQVRFFKDRVCETDDLRTECRRLNERIKTMESVQVALQGSRDQVDEMLKHNKDPKSLTILITILKKELVEADRKKRQISKSLTNLQNDMSQLKRQTSHVQRENEKLRLQLDEHKQCESTRSYLKDKIQELQEQLEGDNSTYTPNDSVRRVILESPAPYRPDLNEASADLQTESPSISEKVEQIMNSDSPYLPLKSSSVGVHGLMKAKYSVVSGGSKSTAVAAPEKYSFFNSRMEGTTRASKPEYNYNGLGGTSKDEQFPTPHRSSMPLSLKRNKSSSTLPSSKFRKLSNNIPKSSK